VGRARVVGLGVVGARGGRGGGGGVSLYTDRYILTKTHFGWVALGL